MCIKTGFTCCDCSEQIQFSHIPKIADCVPHHLLYIGKMFRRDPSMASMNRSRQKQFKVHVGTWLLLRLTWIFGNLSFKWSKADLKKCITHAVYKDVFVGFLTEYRYICLGNLSVPIDLHAKTRQSLSVWLQPATHRLHYSSHGHRNGGCYEWPTSGH